MGLRLNWYWGPVLQIVDGERVNSAFTAMDRETACKHAENHRDRTW